MRTYGLIAAAFLALLVLPMAALAENEFPVDPKKGGLEAEGPGEKPNKLPVGRKAATATTGRVRVPSSKARIFGCDGTFYGKAKVIYGRRGSVRQFTATAPGRAQLNKSWVKHSPKRFTLAPNGVQFIDVSGSLKKHCNEGRIAVQISWPGPIKKGRFAVVGTRGNFDIPPAILQKFGLGLSSTQAYDKPAGHARFAFHYNIYCCPGIRGHYKLANDRKTNIKEVRIRRDSFVCPLPRGALLRFHETYFIGTLKDRFKMGTIDFKISRFGGASCLDKFMINPVPRY